MRTKLPICFFESHSSETNVFLCIRKTWTFLVLLFVTWSAYAGPGDVTGPACTEVGQPAAYTVEPESSNFGYIEWWSDMDGAIDVDSNDRTKVSVTPTDLNPTYVVLTAGITYNEAPWYKTYSITVQVGCSTKREGIKGPDCLEENEAYDFNVIAPYNGYSSIDWSTDGDGTFIVDSDDPAYATFEVGKNNPSTITLTAEITYDDATKNKTFTTTVKIGGCTPVTPGITGPSCVEPAQANDFSVVPTASNYTGITWSSTGNATLTPDPADPSKVSVTYPAGSPASVTLTADVTYANASLNESFNVTVQVGGCNPTNPEITGPACVEPMDANDYTVVPSFSNFTAITWSSTGDVTVTPDPGDPTKVTVEYDRGNPSSVTLTAAVTYPNTSLNESVDLTIQVGGCTQINPEITGPDCADLSKTYTFTVTPSNNNYSDITWSSTGNATVTQDPNDPAKVTVKYASGSPASVTLTADITYVDASLNESIDKTVQVGGCNPGGVGISGPACVELGQPYTFKLTPDQDDFYWVEWWTDGDATIVKDTSDPTTVTVTFTTENTPGSVVTLTSGVDFSSAPWWKSYSTQVQLGGCTSPSFPSASTPIVAAPHPFIDEATLSLANGEDIISVKVYDGSGIEVLAIDNVNAKQVKVGHRLNPGLYTVQIISRSGSYADQLVKGD